MDTQSVLQGSVERLRTSLEGIADDQWGAPTPCPEWTVRDLVQHITYENAWVPALLAGETVEAIGARFDGDLLGDDAVGAATRAAEAAATAVADSLATPGTVNTSAGDIPKESYVVQMAFENLIHGWDLAAATHGDRGLDADLVAELGPRFDEYEDWYRSSGGIGPRRAPTGEPAGDLLARFGRDRDWSPEAAADAVR